MGATTLQSLPTPNLSDTPNLPSQLLTFGNAIEKQIVMSFATAVARDAAVTSPVSGMFAWLTTPKQLTYYDGTSWLRLIGRTGGEWRRNATQSISTGTLTAISFDTEDFDSDAFATPTTSTITIPAGLGGRYLITGHVGYVSATLGSPQYIVIVAGGRTFAQPGTLGGTGEQVLTVLRTLAAGNTIQVSTLHNNGGAVNCTADLTVERLAA